MPIKMANRVKTLTASGGGDLDADSRESFFLKDIVCAPSTNDTYLTLRVDSKTIYAIRVKGKGGNHCPPLRSPATPGLMPWLRKREIEIGIPVGAGQTLHVDRYAETGEVHLIYDQGDAGDYKSTDVNGSDSKIRRYPSYGTYNTALTASAWATLNDLLGAEELPGFPWTKAVPSGTVMRMLALGGCPCQEGNGSQNEGYSDYLRLLLDGDCLSDDDMIGWRFHLAAATADSTTYDTTTGIVGGITDDDVEEPLIFVPSLEFKTGQQLDVQVYLTIGAGANFAASQFDVWALLEQQQAV